MFEEKYISAALLTFPSFPNALLFTLILGITNVKKKSEMESIKFALDCGLSDINLNLEQ